MSLNQHSIKLEAIKENSLKNNIEISNFLESKISKIVFKRGLKISEKIIKNMPRSVVCLISCLTLDRPYLCDNILNLAIENNIPIIFTHSREYAAKILKDNVYTVCTVVQSLDENIHNEFKTQFKNYSI